MLITDELNRFEKEFTYHQFGVIEEGKYRSNPDYSPLTVENVKSFLTSSNRRVQKTVAENIIKIINEHGQNTEIAVNDLLNYADHLITNQ